MNIEKTTNIIMNTAYNLSKLTSSKIYDMFSSTHTSSPNRMDHDNQSSSVSNIKSFFHPASKVLPGIYIGSAYNAARDDSFDVVVNCACEVPIFYFKNRKTIHYPLRDSLEEVPSLSEASMFIRQLNKIIKEKNNAKILFHCFAGRSRSAFMLALYLLKQEPKLKVDRVYEMLIRARPCVAMNTNFYDTLLRLQ